MHSRRDFSPKTTISHHPKSLTLNIEQFSPRATFKTSFPTKKFSEMHKNRKESLSTLQKPIQKKARDRQKGTLEVDASSLKEILNMKIFKAVFKHQAVETPKTPKIPFKNRFKYKMIRATQSHRINPTVCLDTTENPRKLMSKGSKCLVIETEPHFQEKDHAYIAKSPEVCIRTSNGSTKKFDSYMYLRKVKAKGEKRSLTEVRGQSALKQTTNRQLYIMKENNRQRRKSSYLTSYCGLKAQLKKGKERKMKTDKEEYRPWSACRSQRSD